MATAVAQSSSAVAETAAPLLVYFSSTSGNTARFIEKLGLPAVRIPLHSAEPPLIVDEPFVLVTPTYGGGQGKGEEKGAVPRQVIRFLNEERNRSQLRGVVSAGNTNFGAAYCIAGDIIARKCGVPHLYKFELLGTTEDVACVREGIERLWQQP